MTDTQEQIVEGAEVIVEPAEDTPEIQEEPQEQVQEQPSWSSEDEDEARLFGWKSPDEWQGEMPKGYIDNPEDFLGRVKRSRIFSTMSERLESTTKGLEQVNEMALRRQREKHEAEVERVRQERDRAAEEGDMDAYKIANTREQELLSQAAPTTQPQTPAEVEAYRNSEAGAWLKNPILGQTAAQLVQSNPVILAAAPADQIAYAEAEIRKMYPAYFPEPKTKEKTPPRQVVDAGGLGGAGGRSAFEKLPPDAKQAFKRFAGQGIFEDTAAGRKEYADEYNK